MLPKPARDRASGEPARLAKSLLLGLVLLLAAARQPDASQDLPVIRSARSLVAEWALVNRVTAERRVTDTYATVMRRQLRRKLTKQWRALSDPASPAGQAIATCLHLPDDAASAVLQAQSQRLLAIEARLEAA